MRDVMSGYATRRLRPSWAAAIVQDIGLGVRRLGREPALVLAVSVTLAVGVGASTAVFGLASTTLASRVPYEAPDRLVVGRSTTKRSDTGSVSEPDFFDYRDSSRAFERLSAFWARPRPAMVTGGDEPVAAVVVNTSWDFFHTLGARPALGRLFLPEEEGGAGGALAIVSHTTWQTKFGGAADIVGRTIAVDASVHTIVGVLPRDFGFWAFGPVLGTSSTYRSPSAPLDIDVWTLVRRPGEPRHLSNYYLLGRLRPGVTMGQAQTEVDAVSTALQQAYPASNAGRGLRLTSLHEYMGGDVRSGLVVPAAVSACLLLIACANVTGLLLARGQRRTAEIALRAAVGATRWQLIQQMLTESAVLTLPAGLLGVGVAWGLQHVLLSLVPAGRLGVREPVIDGVVLAFALASAVAAGLLAGLVPAIRGTAVNLSSQVGTGHRTGERGSEIRARGVLVAAQVAVSVVLLVGAGLMAMSLARLSRVDLGFSADQVVTARIDLPPAAYPDRARRQAFFSSVLQDIGSLPGVRAVGASTSLPIQDGGNTWPVRTPESLPDAGDRAHAVSAKLRRISTGYFDAMGMSIRQGRGILEGDRDGRPAVAVISESLARRLFPDQSPVGRTLLLSDFSASKDTPYEIVGVVGDARLSSPRESGEPAVYLSILQASPARLRIAVRSGTDAAGLAASIRRLVRLRERNALVSDVATMSTVLETAFASFRLGVWYVGGGAAIALFLAAVGLYGALACHVGRQRHDIGVRLALGATRADILGLVLARVGLMVAAGLLLGVTAAYPCTALVRSLLFDTAPLDPGAYAGAAVVLGLTAAAACLAPAWRATRIDPAQSLRHD